MMLFDYNAFYNYWSNFASNCSTASEKLCYFYYKTPHKNQNPVAYNLPQDSIEIDGIKVYVKPGLDDLIFTTPIEIDGRLWDFHYHVGIFPNFTDNQSTTKPKQKITAVFFKKTSQIPVGHHQYDHTLQGKEHTNCYFRNGESLTSVSNIVCRERQIFATMQQVFPNEVNVIKEILTKPFVTTGGGNCIFILRRKRKVTKDGRKSMITYRGKQISLTEARSIERKQKKK